MTDRRGETRPSRTPPIIDARRIGAGEHTTGDFTFAVLVETAKVPSDDRRRAPRRRTRLRSGKILDGAGHFLTECLFHDVSSSGGRLKLQGAVVLPAAVQVFDDRTGDVHQAAVLWRKGRDAGVAFKPAAIDARSRKIAADMRRKFYAVRD